MDIVWNLLKLSLFSFLLFFSGLAFAGDIVMGYYNNATKAAPACFAGSWGPCYDGTYLGKFGYKWCTENDGKSNCNDTQHWYLVVNCPSPNVLNQNTGVCEPPEPPPNCTSGDQKTITEFQSSGNTIIYLDQGPKMSSGGCQYQCGSGSDTYHYDSSGTYHDRSCVGTGEPASSGDTPGTSVPSGATSVSTDKESGATCSMVGSHRACVGGNIPEGCFEADGVRSCQNDSVADSSVVDHEQPPISSDSEKNCVRASTGKVLCVVDESDTIKQYCGTVNGVKTCYTGDTKAIITTTNETTITNPDGTIITTINETTNIRNAPDTVIEKVTNTDGTTTTTKQGTGNGDGSGGNDQQNSLDLDAIAKNTAEIAKNTSKSECEKSPNSIGCSDLSEGVFPEPDPIPTIEVPIALQYSSWGDGSCPSSQTISLHGFTAEISYQPYCDLALGIRPLFIALAFMSAAFIVFGEVKD